MKQTLAESTLGMNYVKALETKNLSWEAQACPPVAQSFIVSIADFLAMVKSKDNKVALAIQNYENVTKFAGIVSYTPAETEDAPGEWSLTFTFDPKDIEDCQVYTIHDSFFQNVALSSSFKETGLKFNQTCFLVDMFSVFADELYKWLDVNAKDSEVVELECDGYFTAQVAFEEGHKVFSVIPDEEIRQKVKSDASEKVA
jgi:hypothetical protein